MIWEDWVSSAADALGVTTTQAGTMLSLLLTGSIIVSVIIATRGRGAAYSVSITGLLFVILFTFMGWLGLWVGTVIALVISIFLGMKISGTLGG